MKHFAYIAFYLVTILSSSSALAIFDGHRPENRQHRQVINWIGPSERCSGLMIHPNVMLTAGHCLFGATEFSRITVAGQERTVKTIVNPNLPTDFWQNPRASKVKFDLMFIVFKSELQGDVVSPVVGQVATAEVANSFAQAIGVGTGYDSEMSQAGRKNFNFYTQSASFSVLPHQFLGCVKNKDTQAPEKKLYGNLGVLYAVSNEGRNTCMGDSGGAFFNGDELIGTISSRVPTVNLEKTVEEVCGPKPKINRAFKACSSELQATLLVDLRFYRRVIDEVLRRAKAGAEITPDVFSFADTPN